MSTIKTQTIQPPSDSDGLTFRTNQSDRVTIGADGFVRISNGTVTGGITLNGTLNLIGGITASGGATFGGRLRVTDSTASSSTSTGALVVSGGVGVGGALNVASTGNFSGLLTLAGATSSAIISCATAPTLGQHLANKSYVDNLSRIGTTAVFMTKQGLGSNATYGATSTLIVNVPGAYTTVTAPSGTRWLGWYLSNTASQYPTAGIDISDGGSFSTTSYGGYSFFVLTRVS